MKLRILIAFVFAVLSVAMPAQYVQAQAEQAKLLIVELAVAGKQEFVEIYNPGEEPIDLACFSLQYRVATSSSDEDWSNKYRFSCERDTRETVILAPHSRLLLASYDEPTVEGELEFASGLRDAGGQLRLIQNSESVILVHDQLGYGDAVQGENAKGAAKAPADKQSLKRKVSEDGIFIDTNDNALDFIVSNTPTPQRDDIDVDEKPGEDPEPEEPGKGSGEYTVLQINELLPDPAPPQQDDTDEFIEIYNPTNATVSLKGYVIQSGSNFQYSYSFGDDTIGPLGFVVVRSADSDLTLSNSGGKVRLLDPDEKVQDEITYPLATSGQSYAKASDGWHWSTTPSPAVANVITVLPPPPAKSTKAVAVKKAATPKASSTKPKTTATTKQATKTASKAATPVAKPATIDNAPNFWILLPIGALVIGYGLYEYRKDITIWWRKLLLAVKAKQ